MDVRNTRILGEEESRKQQWDSSFSGEENDNGA